MSSDPDLNQLCRMPREQLHAHAVRYFKVGRATVPDVALVACGSYQAIFKDYGRTPGWFSRILAPLLIGREVRALRALDDIPTIPRLYRRVGACAMLIEYCPATPLPQANPADAAYAHLDALVSNMHAHGVAHCDLRGAGNILVDRNDQTYIIDFASHIRRGRPWNAPWNWIFRRFVLADQSALAKLRLRHAEHLASPRDYELRDPNDRVSRIARHIGQTVRRVVRFFTKNES